MIFCPDGSEEYIKKNKKEEIYNWLSGNKDRSIILVVTETSLYFYLSESRLLAASYERSEDEVNERGKYKKAYWNYTSGRNHLVVLTSTNSIYIYLVEVENYVLSLSNSSEIQFQSPECCMRQRVQNISLNLSVVAKFESIPTCLALLRDDLFIGLDSGWLHRITWQGDVINSFRMCDVPFAADQSLNKIELPNFHPAIYPVDAVFCPLMGGICVVLNDGRAALLISPSLDFKSDVTALWISGLKDAICCEVNHRFRLLYFATKNLVIYCFSLDDTSGTFYEVFRINILPLDVIEHLKKSNFSVVCHLRCLPQGLLFDSKIKISFATALPILNFQQAKSKTLLSAAFIAVCNVNFKNSSMPLASIISAFGSLCWSSIENSSSSDLFISPHSTFAEWGPEGYQLWFVTPSSKLAILNIMHSLPNSSTILLVGDDRIYLSPTRSLVSNRANAPHLFWRNFVLPHEYLVQNWPIKHVAYDSRVIVVSGRKGFCYFDMEVQRWRLFRKEAQEQAFFVSGGITTFDNHIICSVNKTDDESDCLLTFDLSSQLDLEQAQATSIKTNRILLLNLSGDHLISFDVNSAIRIYLLKKQMRTTSKTNLAIDCLVEVFVGEFLPHPMCMLSLHLLRLYHHPDAGTFSGEYDSILLNVSGHLLLLNPLSNDGVKPMQKKNSEGHHLFTPTLIASSVEQIWSVQSSSSKSVEIPFLDRALWINAGSKTKVWIPLYQEKEIRHTKARNFIASRIMLPIDIDLYPLTLDESYLSLGIVPTIQKFGHSEDSNLTSVYGISRASKVFIHFVLRQLLTRNLGSFALRIATACRSLPYFNYLLELLLHTVLDEEATSIEPIPDPLLPTVVSFISEFSEYLPTIIHCSRKTELAHWKLLFSVTHHPRYLFNLCLQEDLLDTAIAALIVLQSMESTLEGIKHALVLLEEALNKKRWSIARDIVRFIRGTLTDELNNGDLDTSQSPLYQKFMSSSQNRAKFAASTSISFDLTVIGDDHNLFNASGDSDKFGIFTPGTKNVSKSNISATPKQHSQSIRTRADTSPQFHLSDVGSEIKSDKLSNGVHAPLSVELPSKMLENSLEAVLNRYAANFIECFSIRDFFLFASYVSFDLVNFFKQSKFAVPPKSFPLILMKMHVQFSWPYPVAEVVKNGCQQKLKNDNGENADTWSLCSSLVNTEILNDFISETSTLDNSWVIESLTTNDEKVHKECNIWKPKSKPMREREVDFVFNQLLAAGAFEWAFFVCVLRRSIHFFCDKLLPQLNNCSTVNLKIFVSRVSDGTNELLNWAKDQCPAYTPVLNAFKEFMEES